MTASPRDKKSSNMIPAQACNISVEGTSLKFQEVDVDGSITDNVLKEDLQNTTAGNWWPRGDSLSWTLSSFASMPKSGSPLCSLSNPKSGSPLCWATPKVGHHYAHWATNISHWEINLKKGNLRLIKKKIFKTSLKKKRIFKTKILHFSELAKMLAN